MNDLYLVIPMAGNGTRFSEYESDQHKPLIEIDGIPMFLRALNKIRDNSKNNFKVILIIKKEDKIFNELQKFTSNCLIIELDRSTQGSLETIYLGLENIHEGRFLSLDCDLECFSQRLDEHIFRSVESPALVTFNSQKPIYSYVRMNGDNVVEIKEKSVISRNAVAGQYYFNDVRKFKEDCKKIFKNSEKTLGEYYISNMITEILNQDREILAYESTFYKSYGTPAEIEEYTR